MAHQSQAWRLGLGFYESRMLRGAIAQISCPAVPGLVSTSRLLMPSGSEELESVQVSTEVQGYENSASALWRFWDVALLMLL